MAKEADVSRASLKRMPWEDKEVRLQQLLLAGLDGADQPYKLFLQELSVYLRGFFTKRMQFCLSDVEDLVQETLLAIHNKRHTYEHKLSLSAWVFAIAKYKYVDHLRSKGKQRVLQGIFDEQSELFSDQEHESKEAQMDIEKLLSALPDRYKLAIVYTKLKGYSVAEAAGLIGISESAVKVGVHRGLKLLALNLRNKV